MNIALGRNVRNRRNDRGWTQEELGRAAGGVNKETIVRLERGHDVKLETLQRVLTALGLSIAEAFGEPAAPDGCRAGSLTAAG